MGLPRTGADALMQRSRAETGGSGHWDVVFDSTRIVFGAGRIECLGQLVRDVGGRRVLLVTDPNVRKAGHVDRALQALEAASLSTFVFDGVDENPTTAHVDAGTRFAAERQIDCVVGLGGGSAMDCTKAVNFLLTNGGKMEDYRGFNKASRPMLPAVGVPTTAGTGSEAQSYALISEEKTLTKMACGDSKARFRSVILDPTLLPSVPRSVAAATGLDAVSHAVESYVTRRRNPLSAMFAAEAWRLLDGSLETVLASRTDVDAWGRMLLGAHLAGAAIEHSMLGAAHACANPLTARFGVTHGLAVMLMLPHVMHYNAEVVGRLFDELLARSTAAGRLATLQDRVTELRDAAGVPAALRDYDVPRDCLADMAEEAAAQWTAGFNPREVTGRELLQLYEAAY